MPVLWVASCTLLEPGPFLGLEVLEGYFTGWTEILGCALYVSKRMIFCSSLMLIATEIFPKLCSIPLLMSASSPTITGIISVFTLRISVISISRSLYFEIFFSGLCRGVLVGWYWHIGKLATSVAVVLDHYLYQACSLTTVLVGCNYQTLCLSFPSRTSEPLVGFCDHQLPYFL